LWFNFFTLGIIQSQQQLRLIDVVVKISLLTLAFRDPGPENQQDLAPNQENPGEEERLLLSHLNKVKAALGGEEGSS
jgi:hypothetical protein